MKKETIWEHERRLTGVVMVLMGAIFLLGTSGITIAGRSPWMLVGVIPIYWIGVSAYRSYKEEGRLTRRVLSIAVYALIPFAYIAALALGYSVSRLWPLGIIVVGISFLLLGGKPSRRSG
ncbi:MAG: hypothetical protein KIT08_10370 [Anaerolineales bacterium]|nr:MAG: hypothetical protein KIT08_10370 [Anaerolineales bacterium]